MFGIGYLLQRTVIRRGDRRHRPDHADIDLRPNLILENALLVAFKADYRKLNLAHPLGVIDVRDYVDWLDVVVPVDRLVCTLVAVILVVAVYLFLRSPISAVPSWRCGWMDGPPR